MEPESSLVVPVELAKLLHDLEIRWQNSERGERPSASDYWGRVKNEPNLVAWIVELVRKERELRREASEDLPDEHYLEQFADIRELLQWSFEVERTRWLDGERMTAEDVLQTPVSIGPYRLLRLLGEGGMGMVFEAEQLDPMHRRVALKILQPGRRTDEDYARFEQERQALALMDHPNIAKILDAGATPKGSPFFVMELVDGIPITQYCEQQHLTPRERLALFVPVCQAVQHAHQKGIIHRDLKPTNVLVALSDGKPFAKVIDFGVAKPIGRKLTKRNLRTEAGNVMGTWPYMAPEQTDLDNLDVDTRADIYALGAILYELLTASTPFTTEVLQNVPFDERVRMIREVDPPRPSVRSRISKGVSSPPQLSKPGLTRLAIAELDCLVMKCLEKDRGRRYDTASALAEDITRFLEGKLILAVPPSFGYRMTKFLRRHKGPVLAASLVLIALIGGIVGTTAGLFEARKQTERAKQEENNSKDVLAFLVRTFRTPDVGHVEGQRVTVAEVLEGAVKRSEVQFKDRPLVQEQVLEAVGTAALSLKLRVAVPAWDTVVQLRTVRLGPHDLATLDAMHKLASAYLFAGDPKRAIATAKETRDKRRAVLGSDHHDTLTSTDILAEAYREGKQFETALRLHTETLQKRQAALPADHPDIFESMNNLGLTYQEMGRLGEAIARLKETVERERVVLKPTDPSTWITMNNLAEVYRVSEQFGDATPLFREVLAKRKAVLGDDHQHTLNSANNLALTLVQTAALEKAEDKRMKLLDEAIPLFKDTLERRKKQGFTHPLTLHAMHNLALAYRHAGKFAEAIKLLQETYQLRVLTQGTDHLHTLKCRHNLAELYALTNNRKEAIALYCDTLQKLEKKLGQTHLDTLRCMYNLAVAYREERMFKEAETTLIVLHSRCEDPTVSWSIAGKRQRLDALEKIVQLYDGWEEKRDQAEKWRKILKSARLLHATAGS